MSIGHGYAMNTETKPGYAAVDVQCKHLLKLKNAKAQTGLCQQPNAFFVVVPAYQARLDLLQHIDLTNLVEACAMPIQSRLPYLLAMISVLCLWPSWLQQ